MAELQWAGATSSVIFGRNSAINFVAVVADIHEANSANTQAGSRYGCQKQLPVMVDIGCEPLRLVAVNWIFSEAGWALYAPSGGLAVRQVGWRVWLVLHSPL